MKSSSDSRPIYECVEVYEVGIDKGNELHRENPS
jgi:hypothetical protein